MTDIQKDYAVKIFWTAVGQFISATGFCCILDANRLVGTGIGGFSLVLNRLTGLPSQLFMLAMAVPIILWAYFRYSKKQIFFGALNFFLFTIFTAIVPHLLPSFKTDLIVAAVAGGVVSGIASGIVMKQHTANGPEGIVALYINEHFGISVGTFFLVLNSIVIFSSILSDSLTLICYSVICTAVSSFVTDKVIIGMDHYYVVSIMSDQYLDITEYIRNELHREVTFVQGMDTSNVKKKILLRAIVSKQDLLEIKNFAAKYHDDTLIYAGETTSIAGRGFDVQI